jgi:signal transduction histidine kinase
MSAMRLDPRRWSLRLKVPLIVAGLMVAVSIAVTQQVLDRLAETQHRQLTELTGAYLDGLSTALLPHVVHEDVWEVFDILDRSRNRYAGLAATDTVVSTPDGRVLAATDPHRFPVDTPMPADWRRRFPTAGGLLLDAERETALAVRTLDDQGRAIGRIYAEADISALLAERREVLVALVATNGTLTLLLCFVGYLLVQRMLRPVDVLARHLERLRGGDTAAIPEAELGAADTEFGQLFRRFNAMAAAVEERNALAGRLAAEERLASLGRLATGMAHEINNPLGGLLNALDTLRAHGHRTDVRHTSIALLERGLHGIRDVVRSLLVTYKASDGVAPLRPQHLDDLRILVQHEVARRQLDLVWDNRVEGGGRVRVGLLRQAALNLLLNACNAAPFGGRVDFRAHCEAGRLRVKVADRGAGLPPAASAVLRGEARAMTDQGRRGVGLWMVRQCVDTLKGRLEVETSQAGTSVCLDVPLALPASPPSEEVERVA